MSSSSVWVQLYYKGKAESEGRPTSVKKPTDLKESDWNIDALAEAVKDKRQVALSHCDAADLVVYPLGTAVPIQDGVDALPSRTNLATLNLTEEDTLIVVAPAPKKADGEEVF